MGTKIVHPDGMGKDDGPDPEVPERARMRRFSAAYKARVLAEYEGLGKAEKGVLLRRELRQCGHGSSPRVSHRDDAG